MQIKVKFPPLQTPTKILPLNRDGHMYFSNLASDTVKGWMEIIQASLNVQFAWYLKTTTDKPIALIDMTKTFIEYGIQDGDTLQFVIYHGPGTMPAPRVVPDEQKI